MRKGGIAIAAFGACLSAPLSADVYSGSGEPILLQADHVAYDRTGHRVMADGNVEAAQGKRVLKADHIVYDTESGEMEATGHVSLLDDSGNILFADTATADKTMSNGTASPVKFLMTDNSRAVANEGVRADNILVLNRAVFSSCNLCKSDPDRAPLWEIKAARVTHDDVAQKVEYEDAELDFFGIPVFFTPYLSHPDPSVARQSGFLIPGISNSSDLGFRLTIPYYVVINDSQDAVIAPTYTSQAGVGLLGDYRQRFSNAVMELQGSILDSSNDSLAKRYNIPEVRWHIFGLGEYDFDDSWKASFSLQRASDATYLRRFQFSNATLLTSSVDLERITAHDVFTVDNYAFQDVLLTSPVPTGLIPYVAPLINYEHYGTPGWLESHFDYGANGLDIVRPDGRSVRRLGGDAKWALPVTNMLGQQYELDADVRETAWWATGSNRIPAPANIRDRYTDRSWPTLSFNWRWPFVRDDSGWRQVIEPIALLAVSPWGGNKRIPNEDSTTVEFDDTNLFSTDRFSGIDLVETGPRANLGAQWSLYAPGGQQVSVLLGEVLRAKTDRALNRFVPGVGDRYSDYVARIIVKPTDWLDVVARARLNHESGQPQETQIQAQMGPSFLRVGVGYLETPPDATDPTIQKIRQINASIFARFTPNYYITAVGTHDLLLRKWITFTTGVWYTDECLDAGITIMRTNVTSGELRSSTSVGLVLRLKSIGSSFLLPGFSTPL